MEAAVDKVYQHPINNQSSFDDQFQVMKVLGEGGYGCVKLARNKETGKKVAVKFIMKEVIQNKNYTGVIPTEVFIMKKIQHPNLMGLITFYETYNQYLLVMEAYGCMDLFDFIHKTDIVLDERLASFVFRQIVAGLHHLHTEKIVHRDLKPENILVDNNLMVKVIDFGLSAILAQGEILTSRTGTPMYMAPEILKGEPYNGFEQDVFSSGMVLYELMYKTTPSRRHLRQCNLMKPDPCSEGLWDLLLALLNNEPCLRPTTKDLVQDPWVCQPVEVVHQDFMADLKPSDAGDMTHKKRKRSTTSPQDILPDYSDLSLPDLPGSKPCLPIYSPISETSFSEYSLPDLPGSGQQPSKKPRNE